MYETVKGIFIGAFLNEKQAPNVQKRLLFKRTGQALELARTLYQTAKGVSAQTQDSAASDKHAVSRDEINCGCGQFGQGRHSVFSPFFVGLYHCIIQHKKSNKQSDKGVIFYMTNVTFFRVGKRVK